MTRRRPALLAAGLVLTLGLAACGGDNGGGSDGGLANPGEGPSGEVPADTVKIDGSSARVLALDNAFRAPDIEIKAGTTVTWTNRGHNDHDVLPVQGSGWGTKRAGLAPGASYSTTFDRAGVYHYYCSIHGTKKTGMVGTIVVDH